MSSDEIDIEEHDVLADPRLRHLLPDLARVKTEPTDYDEGTPELGYEPFTGDVAQHAGYSVRNAPAHSDSSEHTRHDNKIILGSKPAVKPTVVRSSNAVGGDTNGGGVQNGDSVVIFGKRVNIKQEIDTDFVENTNVCSNVIESQLHKPDGPEVQSESGDNVNEDVDMHEDNGELHGVQEQIPENCRVSLENWGPRLLRNPCYCEECKILFATRNALDAHKMACHSFLVAVDNNRAMKSTSRNVDDNLKSCAQCNKKFADYSQLLAHVYGHLASKIPEKKKEKDVPKPSVQAQFSNKISLGSKPSSEVSFPDSESGSDDDVESGFYRCLVCSYYSKNLERFNSHNIKNHFIMKPKASRVEYDKNCRFCSYRNDNFVLYNAHIYGSHANLYTKKAETVAQNKNIHLPPLAPEGVSVKIQCTVCSQVFQNYKIAKMHRKSKHPDLKQKCIMKKLITKNFEKKIAHNIPDILPSTSNKRKAEDPYIDPKKAKLDAAVKIADKITVYYCDYCKGTMWGKRYVALHLERKCTKSLSQPKYVCTTCGLLHSVKGAHTSFHEKHPDKTIHDFQFVRVQDNAVIGAPIPKYPSCKVCGVNVSTAFDLEKHECGGNNYKTCRYCRKTFSEDIYLAHVQFHTYIKPEIPKMETVAQNTPDIPEILKKYHMLTETWNILYLCAVCTIVTDSYDKAVEHSQNHFNNLENYDVTIKQCQVCRLMFDDSCLERHMDIHKDNKLINKDSFRILSYDYSKLLTKDWFDLFGNLPKPQIQQIVSRSIYAYCRSVKMTVSLDGAPELTLYQCRRCRTYVYPPSVPKHKLMVCLRIAAKHYCNVCNIPFCSIKGREAHLATHKTRGSYRHVIFNAREDEEFDAALNKNNEEIPKEIIAELKKNKKPLKCTYNTNISGKYKGNKMYQCYICTKCNISIVKKKNVYNHNCSSRQRVLIPCDKCGLNIYIAAMNHHKMRHETNKKYVRKNMRLIKFTRNDDGNIVFENSGSQKTQMITDEGIAKLIKCPCGLHFTAKETFDKHSLICSPELKIPKNNCKACGFSFDALEMIRHKAIHHGNKSTEFIVIAAENNDNDEDDPPTDDEERLDDTENDSVDDPAKCDDDEDSEKHKLYRCGSCNLLFHVKVDIVRHLSVCDPRANKENKCLKCGLKFYSTVLTHMLKVNNCDQLTEDDYDIVTLFPRENAEVDEEKKSSEYANKENWLYKCWQCNIHWLSSKAVASYHYKMNHEMNFKVLKCEVCGLDFPSSTLKRHQTYHHQRLNLTREDLLIYTVPGGGNPNPVVNIQPIKAAPTWSALAKKVAEAESNASNRSIKLYKCPGCEIHFLSAKARCRHLYRCGIAIGKPCKRCGLNFHSDPALMMHISLHHDKLNLQLEDFKMHYHTPMLKKKKSFINHHPKKVNRIDSTQYTTKLYACQQCPIKFLSKDSLRIHLYRKKHGVNGLPCKNCHYIFTAASLFRHMRVHHQKMRLSRKDFVLATINRRDENLDDTNTPTKETEIQMQETSEDNESMGESDKQMIGPVTEQYGPNTIFKCSRCSVHFVALSGYITHRERGVHNRMKTQKCNICGFTFSAISLKKHRLIHHTKMKLRRKDIRVSIDGGNSIGATRDTSQKHHVELTKQSRTIGSSTSKGLFKLANTRTESDVGEEPRTRPQYILSNESKAALDALEPSNKVYKCGICGLHFMARKTMQAHDQCSKVNSANTDTCSVCGLLFRAPALSKHFYIHHEKLDLELEDLEIIVKKNKRAAISTKDNTTNKIAPAKQIRNEALNLSDVVRAELDAKNYDNTLYKCFSCERHFINSITKSTHTLNCTPNEQKNADCPICGLTFSLSTLPKHFYVHHDKLNLGLEDFNIITGGPKTESKETKNKERNETPKKKERSEKSCYTLSEAIKADINLSLYSNKLFKCVRCGRHFLNKTTRHTHEPKCSSTKQGDIHDCSICGLAFNIMSLAKHVYIHHERLNLELEDFEIIKTINYQGPKISTNSYEFDGSFYINMPKTSDNASDTSLDRTTSKNLRKRVRNVSESSFDLSRTSSTHNLTSELETSSYDDDGIATPISTRILNEYKKYPLSLKVLKTININLYNNKLYHCTICGAYFLLRNTLEKHIDKSRHVYQLVDCEKCDYKFSIPLLPRHDYIQHGKLQLAKEDLEVITEVEIQRTLNKCVKCNAHYLSQKHKCVSSLEKCIICDLMFAGKSLNPHYEKHHRKLKLSAEDFIICETGSVQNTEPIDAKDVSETVTTKVEPSTSKQSLEKSSENSEVEAPGDVGKTTDVTPPKVALTSKETPQQELDLSDEPPDLDTSASELDTIDDSVVSQSSNEALEDKSEEPTSSSNDVLCSRKYASYTTKLYKCSECKVHFLSQATCYKHTHKNHVPLDPFDYIACKICGLEFGNMVLPKHVIQHHKNKEFNLDQVLVEAYTPNKGAGAPKIELYLAIDKVQSKLVSTTTEKYVPVSSTSGERKDTGDAPESTTLTENRETTTDKRDNVVEKEETSTEKLQSVAKKAEPSTITTNTSIETKESAAENIETAAEIINKPIKQEPVENKNTQETSAVHNPAIILDIPISSNLIKREPVEEIEIIDTEPEIVTAQKQNASTSV